MPDVFSAPMLHALERGQGDPVVFIHGLGSSHEDFGPQLDAVSARYRVFAIDLRGHGRSPPAESGVTLCDLAEDVAHLLDDRNARRCHVVGWSLGGLVGAVLAQRRPDLVRRLVLINTPPATKPSGPWEHLLWMERRMLTRWLPLPRLGRFIARRLFPRSDHQDLRRSFEERFARNDPVSYRAVFDAIRKHDDEAVLEAIRCPVLIIAGDRDYWPVSAKAAQCARLARGRLEVVRGSGHATPAERASEVNALLLRFFAEESHGVSPSWRTLGAAIALFAISACGGSDGASPRPPGMEATVPDGAGGERGDLQENPQTSVEPTAPATIAEPSPTGILETDPSPSSSGAPAAPDEPVRSRCEVTETTVHCEHNVTSFVAGTVVRNVYWQTPAVAPPPEGFPVVIVYQGSLFSPELTWGELTAGLPFGGFHQGRLQAMLLDRGFTVIAPEAAGGLAWQTNSGLPYESTTDHVFITELLAAIVDGQFGPADADRFYATGISSGGYMTSRMAVSYPGVFRALAVQSGSYATCLGPICNVPERLPADHPPTLLLHGEADTTVPVATAERYFEALVESGIETEMVVEPAAGHEWLADSPEQITAWFEAF